MLGEFWNKYFELTNEVRPPNKGEYFCNSRGIPVRADFDFTECSFPILRQKDIKLTRKCPHCDLEIDLIPHKEGIKYFECPECGYVWIEE